MNEQALDFYNKGLDYYNDGITNLAIEYFSKALAEDPLYTECYYNLGNIYFNKKEYEPAIQNYKKVLEHDPNEINTLQNLSKVYFRCQDFVNALELLQKAKDIEPDNVDIILTMAEVYMKQNNLDLTVKYYEKASSMCPGSFEIKESLEYAKLKQKEYQQEQEAALDAKKTAPKENYLCEFMSDKDYFNLGVSYTQNNLYHLAVDCFKKCLSINPDFPRASAFIDKLFNVLQTSEHNVSADNYLQLAVNLLKSDKTDIAKDLLKRAVEIDSARADLYLNLGVAHMKCKNVEFAKDSLKKCMELDPKNKAATEYLYKLTMLNNTRTF